ncbi:hypothetical protein CGLO_14115 [Colletotrichum gloeosporioides Cg-14]|uniref:Uncharacterized protein n=1 Tax=Colletotrichum gloeosporioides (strain Cg-14) TaxID=1237896 RepID=T0K4H9_COLGC|nr:hypothetical protein CGLO_14115 [Colletotrichum gloeosporioides Cg-14]
MSSIFNCHERYRIFIAVT